MLRIDMLKVLSELLVGVREVCSRWKFVVGVQGVLEIGDDRLDVKVESWRCCG